MLVLMTSPFLFQQGQQAFCHDNREIVATKFDSLLVLLGGGGGGGGRRERERGSFFLVGFVVLSCSLEPPDNKSRLTFVSFRTDGDLSIAHAGKVGRYCRTQIGC
jgi:hypothetical protein